MDSHQTEHSCKYIIYKMSCIIYSPAEFVNIKEVNSENEVIHSA